MRLLISFMLAIPLFGAASLTMSSYALDADGSVITVVMGGCSAPLSPSSAITGFTVYNHSNGDNIISQTSVTASGCTVTISLARTGLAPMAGAVETANITLATGSNLTDASGNTPSATGNTFLSVNMSASKWLLVDRGAFLAASRQYGARDYRSSFSVQREFLSVGGCVEFTSTTTALNFQAFDYGNQWALLQDGVSIYTSTVAGGGTTFSPLAEQTGLSGSHTYAYCSVAANPGGGHYSEYVRIKMDQGTLGAQPPAKSILAGLGDSIMELYGPQSVSDVRNGNQWQIASALGMAVQYYGANGSQMCVKNGNTADTTSYLSKLSLHSITPAVLLYGGSSGYNDISAGKTPSQLAACIGTFLTNAAAAYPSMKVIVGGLLPQVIPPASTYDVAIAAEVALHSNAVFYSRASWINTAANTACAGSGDRQSDQIHVAGCAAGTLKGYAAMANREIPIVAGIQLGSSFTTSGTLSGTQNQPSSTITVILPAGAVFTGDQTVTLTSSAGGIFCVGASCTASPKTVTPARGANSFSFTLASPSLAPTTVAFTAGQDLWIPPAPLSYTPLAAVPANGLLLGSVVHRPFPGLER